MWAGILKCGATELIILEGNVDAESYVAEILSNGLLQKIIYPV